MVTVKDKDGKVIDRGTEVTSFRGEKAKLISARPSRGEGKVTVEWTSGPWAGTSGEYYPSVFDLPPITE